MDKLIHLILLSGLVSSQENLDLLEENLALMGTATQSPIYSPYTAERSSDGFYGPCSITAHEMSPWWRLDLLNSYNISTVVITNNRHCCPEQTNGAEIRIGNSLENNGSSNAICAVISGLSKGSSVNYSCNGTEGRYVNVVMTGRTSHLTLCEVEVYTTENIALKGKATQSSVFNNWVPENAIDGRRSASDTSTTCSGTASETDSWWRLDLLNIYNIRTVVVTMRQHCCTWHINGAEIRIGNSLENNGNNNSICAVISKVPAGVPVIYSCHGMEGRYVNVVLPALQNLTVCEVEVYETENLASKGTATQSSSYTPWVAKSAADGQKFDSVCSITAYESNSWWRMDLLDYYYVGTVIISNRGDCCPDQTNGAEIRIGNSLENDGNNNPICALISDLAVRSTVSYSCHGMEGRYVNVVMTGRTSHLTLCEVEVYKKVFHKRKTFLRLKFSSSVDAAAERDKILHQLQSALASHISDFNLSWTQLPKKEEEQKEDG
ncbi:hypothetical protein IRJ41_003631, partial [Triplophysa rosa]